MTAGALANARRKFLRVIVIYEIVLSALFSE
jgi:hypothetical protein